MREQASEEFDRDLIKYIFKNGNWLNVDELTNHDGNLQLDFPKSGFDTNNNQMLKSPEFENRVENQATFFAITRDRYKECFAINEEILKILESETENRKRLNSSKKFIKIL